MAVLDDYVPWHDPAFWGDVANIILANYQQWVHPGRIVLESRGADCDSAELAKATGKVVEALRRLGLVIAGDTSLGYCLVGIQQARYVRSGDVAVWPPEDGTIPGQLSLVPDPE